MNDELSAGNSPGSDNAVKHTPQQTTAEPQTAHLSKAFPDERVVACGPSSASEPLAGGAPLPLPPGELEDGLQQALEAVHERLQALEAKLGAVQAQIEVLVKQQEIIQGGLRQLGSRVSDAASSLGAPRLRETFMRILMLYDLTEPAPAHLSAESVGLCRLLSGQIEQFLAVQGIEQIPTDGLRFDPSLHKPVKIMAIDDPAKEATILNTLRHGFRSESGVLRPAEVAIGRFTAKNGTATSVEQTSAATPVD